MTLAEIAAALEVLAAECRDLRASIDRDLMERRRRWKAMQQHFMFLTIVTFSADGRRPISAIENPHSDKPIEGENGL